MRPLIWVEGMIGAGKTTAVKYLAESLDLKPFYEPVEENPYLEDFYRDPKSWAFAMQIHILQMRAFTHHQAAYECVMGQQKGAILDRGMLGDCVFAEANVLLGNIAPLEMATYRNLHDMFVCQVRPPAILLYLDVSVDTALRRIRSRHRECESGISRQYLSQLHSLYRNMLGAMLNPTLDISGKYPASTIRPHPWARTMQTVVIDWNEDAKPLGSLSEAVRERMP